MATTVREFHISMGDVSEQLVPAIRSIKRVPDGQLRRIAEIATVTTLDGTPTDAAIAHFILIGMSVVRESMRTMQREHVAGN